MYILLIGVWYTRIYRLIFFPIKIINKMLICVLSWLLLLYIYRGINLIENSKLIQWLNIVTSTTGQLNEKKLLETQTGFLSHRLTPYYLMIKNIYVLKHQVNLSQSFLNLFICYFEEATKK